MMKKIHILIIAVLAVLSSCQQPEFVEPQADRQGITSLTAYFTKGKYVEKEMGKLVLENGEDLDRYVIPIMYYYPEESDEVTTLHMNRVRVRAELAPNCKIDPPLTILDLNLENEFTYTNSHGESKKIIITGERVPFKTAQFLSFNLINPVDESVAVEGFVDNEAKIIYLFTIDDLNGLVVQAEPWYHGSIKDYETLSQTPSDWNEDRTVTAIAHDGETMQEYQVLKREPSKIKYGFNANTVKELFNIDPYVNLGVPHYDERVFATLAYADGYVILSHGDGNAPIYVDSRNGSYKGEIVTGGMTNIGAITNDEAGNLLLCNYLDENKGVFEIYRTASVTEAPTLFYSYDNQVSLPLGSKIKVCGNIDADAVIVVPFDGITGTTSSGQFLNIIIKGGEVISAEVIDVLSKCGISWGGAPDLNAGVVATSPFGDNGWFYGQYTGINGIRWIRQDLKLGNALGTHLGDNEWLIRAGTLDSKQFNNATYLAHLALHFYPAWEEQPSVWIYDIGDPATVSGYYEESSSIVAYDSWIDYYNHSSAWSGDTRTCGDVVMAQSKDGLRLYVYCYDHHANVLCGYTADCVKRN